MVPAPVPAKRFRFGVFEVDTAAGELWRQGVRVRLHAQPFQVLCLLLERPGEVLSREQISRALWPEGTFVDFEQGVNSAVNRLREALGDKAANPRFVETLARRGYRFVAPVEQIGVIAGILADAPEGGPVVVEDGAAKGLAVGDRPAVGESLAVGESVVATREPAPVPKAAAGVLDRVLARPEDLPATPPAVVRSLFVLLQAMYLGFYVGALANLSEVHELVAAMPWPEALFLTVLVTAALFIPVRVFLLCAVWFRAPGFRERFLRLWPFLFVLDVVWAVSPFLLLHHISFGLALACVAVLVYAPLAQRSLVLMGAGTKV